MTRLVLILAAGLAGCGYTPPARTDVSSPVYVAARDSCETAAATQVNTTNAKTGLAWFASPIRRWSQIGDATSACMDAKGYGRLRWCTPEELRSGNRDGNVVVTMAGVQCSDPPGDPSTHPADTSPPVSAPKAKAGKHIPS